MAVSQQSSSLQAGHARRVRGEGCRGSPPSNQEHGSAGFRASSTCCTLCSTSPIVVDLSIQRICRDDPRGGPPPLQRVRRLHTSLYLLSRCSFSLLRGALTCRKENEREGKLVNCIIMTKFVNANACYLATGSISTGINLRSDEPSSRRTQTNNIFNIFLRMR